MVIILLNFQFSCLLLCAGGPLKNNKNNNDSHKNVEANFTVVKSVICYTSSDS